MTSRLIKSKKLHPLNSLKHIFSMASLDNEEKRKVFGRKPLKPGKKAYSLLAMAIIVIILVSVFAFMPKANQTKPIAPVSTDNPTAPPTAVPQNATPSSPSDALSQISSFFTGISNSIVQAVAPRAPGTIESNPSMNSSVWRQVAANAWQYFQPGVGVAATTGLPCAGGTDSPNFTDWDLGVYVQAVIDAQKLGLIGTNGTWGSSARLEIVVHWLETRELNATTGYPYWFYQASDGKDYHANSDRATDTVDVVDTGRLFVALNNLRDFNSSLAPRINNFVYNAYQNRSDYAALVPGVKADSQFSNSIYAYYIYSGFESFWPNDLPNATNIILNNIFSSGNVTTPEGISVPNAAILGDPLLSSVFDLNNNNSQLMAITRDFYLAHEAYYNATGQYRAFSEGGTLSAHWAYDWLVLPGSGVWVCHDEKGSDLTVSPIVYTKIAMSFLAIYNTTYAYNMVVYLEKALPDPTKGYCEGVDESGAPLTGVGDLTNGLILGAALYAIQHNP